MTSDETYGAEGAAHEGDHVDVDRLTVERSAFASLAANEASVSASAVGTVSSQGAVSVSKGLTGVVTAQGDADVRQGYTTVLVAGGDMRVSQGGGSVLVARDLSVETGGGGVMVAGRASARKAWIGVLLTKNAEVSEDSRVIVDTKAAIIISAVLAAGFAMVAAVLMDAFGNVADAVRHRLRR